MKIREIVGKAKTLSSICKNDSVSFHDCVERQNHVLTKQDQACRQKIDQQMASTSMSLAA